MISESDLHSQLERIDRDLARLTMLVEDAERAAKAPDPEARRKALASVAELSRAWSALDVAARREAVDLLARTIRLRARGPPEIEWRAAEELAEAAEQGIANEPVGPHCNEHTFTPCSCATDRLSHNNARLDRSLSGGADHGQAPACPSQVGGPGASSLQGSAPLKAQ
jgi:hypothetical protein